MRRALPPHAPSLGAASIGLVASLLARPASAQDAPPPPAPPPAPPPGTWIEPAPQPPIPPQVPPAQPAPVQAAPYPYPAPPPYPYPPPGYGAPYGYQPPSGPPPPPLPPRDPSCCRFGVRFDPFDLIFRRLSFQTEVGIWGPFSVELEPTWIFGSPSENLDTTGGGLMASVLVYISGRYLEGFFAKASVGFEKFEATLTDEPLQQSATADVSSPLFGISIGSSTVFGDDFGFNLSGGVGIGFATADAVTLRAGRIEAVFYDKSSSIQLLASLGLGIGF